MEKTHQGRIMKHILDHSNLKSVGQMSSLLDVSHTTLYSYFKKDVLDIYMIEKICKVFGLKHEDFTNALLKVDKFVAIESTATKANDTGLEEVLRENALLKTQLIEALQKIIKLNEMLSECRMDQTV